jgi:lambda family phage portal protein
MASPSSRRLPSASSAVRPHRARPVRRVAAGHAGTMAGWNPQRMQPGQQAMDRKTLLARAEDLAANDGHAASLIDTKTLNITGWGLAPQSRLRPADLDLSVEEVRKIVRAQERAFRLWCKEAHSGGQMHFFDLQGLAVREALRCGEYVFLARMLEDPARRFALALQEVHPERLASPPDRLEDQAMHDGVEIDPDTGAPRRYHFRNPSAGFDIETWQSVDAKRGHRPLVLHGYRCNRSEQWRGEPALASVVKLFKDKYDFLDYEVVAQILTSSIPVAIQSSGAGATAEGYDHETKRFYQRVNPGQFLYLNEGEQANVLQSNRPGNNFEGFFRLILRTIGAAAGVPYEQLLKDFSQTNYSSARAALLEFWRVCTEYRNWFIRQFCDPIWTMVQEEALLRGYWTIPGCATVAEAWLRFRRDTDLWTAVWWTPPPRGYVDPLKEMQANELGLRMGVLSHSDVIGEQGRDAEEVFDQIALDRQDMADRGLEFSLSGAASSRQEPEATDESGNGFMEGQDSGPDILAKIDALKAVCNTIGQRYGVAA